MKIFAGLSRTDYEDMFRAVGALIDERGWSNVSLMEVDEGLIVQVTIKPDQRETKPRLETYLLTDADLERVLRDAALQRRRRESEQQVAQPMPALAPAPSRLVEEAFAAKANGEGPGSSWPTQASSPAPAQPTPHQGVGRGAADFSEVSSQLARLEQTPPLSVPLPRAETLAALLPPAADEEVAPFAPAPMRLSPQPSDTRFDAGVARAAVVMAHIVAARLKSGVPMTSDDPDLASLLEQVRALDESNIGEKG